MNSTREETVKSQVKIYVSVFIALAVMTAVTVFVSYLRLPLFLAVIAALSIAAFKGSLVAGFFMHLATEKKIIFIVLILTVVFFLTLLLLPVFSSLQRSSFTAHVA